MTKKLAVGAAAGLGAGVFLGGFVLGHALGATTALDHVADLRRFAECKGRSRRGSEWVYRADVAERAGERVVPEGTESRWRLRPYQGPLVPGYFELLPVLGRLEHGVVKRLDLPNDPAQPIPSLPGPPFPTD